jgi:hypothetical protein
MMDWLIWSCNTGKLISLELSFGDPAATTYFGKQCVQAVNLLLFFEESIVLCHTAKCKFIHEVDFIWVNHMLVLQKTEEMMSPSPENRRS